MATNTITVVVQIQPAIPAAYHAIPPNKMLGVGVRPTITNMVTVAPPPTPTHSLISAATHHRRTQRSRFGFSRPTKYTVRVAEQSSSSSSSLVGDDEIKPQLYQALKGINRGIFGVPSAKKYEIEALVKQLESQNPTPDPILNLEKMGGCWKLVYSTITILGSKRTKLGLREFVSLGDFLQNIDTAKGKAVNVIQFDVKGLNLLNGRLTIEASFNKASNSRVDINYVRSTITPDQLMSVFGKNFDLLLAIFNPDGWLEITYLDDTMRIGRDDKGNIFILERSHDY